MAFETWLTFTGDRLVVEPIGEISVKAAGIKAG
jgi:hypothetical protein